MQIATKARWEAIHNKDRTPKTKSKGKDSLECIYRGTQQLEIIACGSCGLKAPAFNCVCPDVDTSRCITSGDERIKNTAREIGYAVCSECPYRQSFDPEALQRFIRSRETIHSVEWNKQPEVVDAYQFYLAEMRDSIRAGSFPFPEISSGSGKGIVTIAGGTRYYTASYVLIYHLRKLGCTLPVEVWHLGPLEIDDRMRDILFGLGNVILVDALERLESIGIIPRCFGGWECKSFATAYSQFSDILFLDADNCPTKDPTYLFDSAEYRKSGAIYWPDLPPMGWDITEQAFQACSLPIPGRFNSPAHHNPTDYRPIESGQYLVDKNKLEQRQALQLCMLMNNHSDFFYPMNHRGRPNWQVYGDKSLFYLAWNMLNVPYKMPQLCTYLGDDSGGGFEQYDFSGEVIFQHRCQPQTKYNLHGKNIHPEGWRNKELIDDALVNLRTEWKPSAIYPHIHSPEESALASKVVGNWVLQLNGQEPQLITLNNTGRTSTGKTWAIRKNRQGQTLLIISNQIVGECLLGLDKHGFSWCNHKQNNFLVPYPEKELQIPMQPVELGVWEEIHLRNSYRYPEKFAPNSVVLDIGANIGLSAWECIQRGASHVVCVEPNPTAIQLLQDNLKNYKAQYTIIPAAVWNTFGVVSLRAFGPTTIATVVAGVLENRPEEDKPVISVPFLEILKLCGKRPVFIKLDCEGAEYPILESCQPGQLQGIQIAGEYHGHYGTEYTRERILAALGKATGEPEKCSAIKHDHESNLGYFYYQP